MFPDSVDKIRQQRYNADIMKNIIDRDLGPSIRDFHLPGYSEIPDVGLYLEQTTKYVNSFFHAFPDMTLTPSMVSNYVKKGIVPNPVRKQYYRDQIAYLIYICVIKVSMSMDNIGLMLRLQQATYSLDVAYEYFRQELENVLGYVFGVKDALDNIGVESSEQKILLRKAIIAAAHKMYLEKYFAVLKDGADE